MKVLYKMVTTEAVNGTEYAKKVEKLHYGELPDICDLLSTADPENIATAQFANVKHGRFRTDPHQWIYLIEEINIKVKKIDDFVHYRRPIVECASKYTLKDLWESLSANEFLDYIIDHI